MNRREAALWYARRGWPVLPCHEPAGASACSCGRADCASPAKHPRTHRGLHDASCNPDTIARWWRRWPTGNVGIRTGPSSGIVVVDIDPAHGGDASLAVIEAAHAALPPTATVITGSGGRHLYFAQPDIPIRNSAGSLGAGLDIRGDGGYVLAPPSGHTTGGTYRWATTGQSPAPLPTWLIGLLHRPPPKPVARPIASFPGRDGDTSAWAQRALPEELARIRHSEAGRRNNDLNRAAFALGQLLGGGHLDAALVHDLLIDAGLAIGLHPREVAATVRSGLDAGVRQPRHARSARSPRCDAPDLRTIELPPRDQELSRTPAADLPAPPLP